MFLESKDFLTIWDIAHRWAGYDADATEPQSLPEDAKYWIHKVVFGYFSKDLVLRRKNGKRVLDEDIYLLLVFNVTPWRSRLWECLTRDVFDKDFLNSLYVMRSQIITWCAKEHIDPPAFWTALRPEAEPAGKPTINNRRKDEEIDRLVCQAIARSYWDIDPQIHPAHMAKAKAIRLYGNGKQYKDPDTVKGWILEVDPLKDQRKIGRPPEIPYLIDLETGGLRKD